MKKPEKQTSLCPLIQSECVEDGCKFWLEMERRTLATGAIEKYHECVFIIQIGVTTENSMAINRMNESLGSYRDSTVESLMAIGNSLPGVILHQANQLAQKIIENKAIEGGS